MTRGHGRLAVHFAAAWILLTSCSPVGAGSSSGLVLEEHALRDAPTTEPLTFQPVEGSMQEILGLHATQRARSAPAAYVLINGRPAMHTWLGADELVATEHFSPGDASAWVSVTRGGREVYRIDTGMASPINGLRGLWTYDQHWVLETAFIESETYGGRLTMDGTLIIPNAARQEAFDFQLLRGKPLYFFRTEDHIGLSYDGTDLEATYDLVPHYQCCSAAALNPVHAESMLAFFARRDGTWCYVEAGIFQ